MLKPLLRYAIAVLSGRLDRLPAEDLLLWLPEYQQRAVTAMSRRQEILGRMDGTRQLLNELREKAGAASERGDQPQARRLLEEAERQETALAVLRKSLARSEEAVAEAKAVILREEERQREKRRAWGGSWTPALLPLGRNSPESVAKAALIVLAASALAALMRLTGR